MATVKGDVHDIGKNIVGVVLGCNNYEIIDLGVMVSCETILDTAIEKGADMIGLSGLITPSLDEMVHVAREMTRRGFTTPLLIGGATTSAKHTAVKIAPAYANTTVHVLDASRSVGVVDQLINKDRREAFEEKNQRRHRDLVEAYENQQQKKLLPYAESLKKRFSTDWKTVAIDTPSFLGPRRLDDFPLEEIARYIDWSPFFSVWEMKGKYPAILKDARLGEEARRLFGDVQEMLRQVIDGKQLAARGVYPS